MNLGEHWVASLRSGVSLGPHPRPPSSPFSDKIRRFPPRHASHSLLWFSGVEITQTLNTSLQIEFGSVQCTHSRTFRRFTPRWREGRLRYTCPDPPAYCIRRMGRVRRIHRMLRRSRTYLG